MHFWSSKTRSPTKEFIKQNVTPNSNGLPVRLVLCFDGTGDTVAGSFNAAKGETTGTKDSVYTIFDLVQGGPVVDKQTGKQIYQYAQYFEGVATVDASKGGLAVQAKALFDGATGHGYLDILRNGYKVCCKQLQHDGDNPHEVFIYGFSRGAFIARALASFLQHVGLIKAEYLDKEMDKDQLFQARFRELLKRYMNVTKSNPTKEKHPNELLSYCIPSPRVHVLGAFDTVKTVIPLPIHNGVSNIDFQMDAPGLVDHFRHALALNEARPLFNPDLWKAASEKSNTSYLEAWFFGFHHDVGGGDDIQGLALWPLQWILETSTDNGLVLDPKVEPYSVLFSGKSNTVDIPHEVSLQMFDMTRHHLDSKGIWGLKLNEPYSLIRPQPREYFQFVTKPPYVRFVKPKVFIHPAAYLVFDISSSFRIQVYEWKHFHRFLADRAAALSQSTSVPWWEQQTIQNIVDEEVAVEHFNLLVMGPPGVGKEEMVTKIFGELAPEPKRKYKISDAVPVAANDIVHIHFSTGFGPGGTDGRLAVASFLKSQKDRDLKSRIHAIWYFHDCAQRRVTDSEKALFKLDFGGVPVLVILKNQHQLNKFWCFQNLLKGYNKTQEQSTAKFTAALDSIKSDLKVPKGGKYVELKNDCSEPSNLVKETNACIQQDSVCIAAIKAGHTEVKPKISLATEESVRAYTIWHIFKTTQVKHKFSRNKNSAGLLLSSLLTEPVIESFNMGCPLGAQVIRTRVGASWESLDIYTSGLHDTSLPGDLILICMLDVTIVLAYALMNRPKGTSQVTPLSISEIDKACTWYSLPQGSKSSIQAEVHNRIRDLLILLPDGTPKFQSITNLQMRVIEIVASVTEGDPSYVDKVVVILKSAASAIVGASSLNVGTCFYDTAKKASLRYIPTTIEFFSNPVLHAFSLLSVGFVVVFVLAMVIAYTRRWISG